LLNIQLRKLFTCSYLYSLAAESKSVAQKIDISRTELIRQALRHELDEIKVDLERAAIAEVLTAMSENANYIQESEALYDGIDENLPEEPENWWKG